MMEDAFEEKIIQVRRVAKKTKGGNRIGFTVLVVVGDKNGRVGVALGRARDVRSAIAKAFVRARKKVIKISLKGTTIPHAVQVKHGAAKLLIKPAPKGTGLRAGGAVRAVVEAVGIKDISSKAFGSPNPASNVYATIKALKLLKERGSQNAS